ncbi:uncharacterized protein [Diadema setosum]|uniref:uncharacterized protein n=1 Tax=Diadema setosum TaxID=31175 RepID=UPI003B3BCEE9
MIIAELGSQKTPDRRGSQNLPSLQGMNSEERKHYNRALRDLCRIVKISSKKLDLAGEATGLESDREDVQRFQARRHQHSERTTGTREDFATLSDPDVTLQWATSANGNLNESARNGHYAPDDEEEDEFFEASLDNSTRHHARQKRGHRHAAANDDGLGPVSEGEDEEAEITTAQSLRLQAIYAELAAISKKLQRQSTALQDREESVSERERILEEKEALLSDHASLRQAYKDFSKRWHTLQEEHDKQVRELETIIRERNKENKRQKESFDTLKQANDALRNQLDVVQEQNKKLESQSISLQSRVTNLLRRQELTSRHRDQDSAMSKARAESVKKSGRQQQVARNMSSTSEPSFQKTATSRSLKQHSSSLYDALGILLDWVSEVHLRHYSTDPSKPLESLPSPAITHDRCTRVLPALVEVMGQLPAQAAKLHLPCLQFVYWALLHLDSSDKQHINLSSTYRRLGEELYRPVVVRFASDREKMSSPDGPAEKPKAASFFKSTNLHIRFLSSLIILKTVSQVDYLANVFDVLRADLKDERAKELYLRYQATPIIVGFMKTSVRPVVGCAVDIFLQMSTESIFVEKFLQGCSTEPWFRACATLISSPGLDVKVWEKISIILQKLSKIKSNKPLFESSGTVGIIQEMMRTGGVMGGAGQDNAFLLLNLRSILFNLNLVKSHPLP